MDAQFDIPAEKPINSWSVIFIYEFDSLHCHILATHVSNLDRSLISIFKSVTLNKIKWSIVSPHANLSTLLLFVTQNSGLVYESMVI